MRTALLAALPAATLAVLGVDISQPISESAAKCMVQNGRTFAVVRAWCSYGGADSNAPASIANFWAGGMSHVDAYMFPCPSKDAATQVADLVSFLDGHGTKYGQIWLDIETNPSPGCGWASTVDMVTGGYNDTAAASNCDYIGSLVAAIKGKGKVPGTYASEYMWGQVAGSGCTSASDTTLWYAHYDGNPSFSDFVPFGGWSKPNVKQYSGTGSICGVGIDSNYYP
jgi:hypothetical protein